MWINLFMNVRVDTLVARCSDHRLLLLSYSKEYNKRDFYSNECSLDVEDECKKIVENEWQKRSLDTNLLRGIQKRLSSWSTTLRNWSRQHCSNVEKKIKEKAEKLRQLQDNEGQHNIGEIQKHQRELGMLLKENLKWRQRAKWH